MSNFFIKHYGEKRQLVKLHEECLELANSLFGYLQHTDEIDHVKEEMGDVLNLIEQFKEHWNDGKIDLYKEAKRVRQVKRIKKEQKK